MPSRPKPFKTPAASPLAVPPGVRLTTLPSGLTLIIREDHSAPVVSAQAWCKAGSVDEGRWLGAGLSHVLEHMLFKGTTTRAAGRIGKGKTGHPPRNGHEPGRSRAALRPPSV